MEREFEVIVKTSVTRVGGVILYRTCPATLLQNVDRTRAVRTVLARATHKDGPPIALCTRRFVDIRFAQNAEETKTMLVRSHCAETRMLDDPTDMPSNWYEMCCACENVKNVQERKK